MEERPFKKQDNVMMLEVDYSTELDCEVFPGLEGEAVIDLNTEELTIDISPDMDDAEHLAMEFEETATDLAEERNRLRQTVIDLESEVAKLKSHAVNIPAPTLYVQLNATRKSVQALEKRNQELEAEIEELTIRLDKKCDHEKDGCYVTKPVTSMRKPPTLRKTMTAPIEKSKIKKHPLGPTDELESSQGISKGTFSKRTSIDRRVLDRVDRLGDGIDGLESRLQYLLTDVEVIAAQKYRALVEGMKSMQASGSILETDAVTVRAGIGRLVRRFDEEIQVLQHRLKEQLSTKNVEISELEESLEIKNRNIEESKKQMLSLSDENKQQGYRITELENTIEELQFQIASMKTQKLIPGGMQSTPSYRELDAMMARICQLEASLQEQQTMNETLLRERRETEDVPFTVTKVEEIKTLDQLTKENKELRNELMEVSEKLVDTEDQNDALRDNLQNQSDFFGQCLHLEEELQARKRVNRGLSEQLARRKKRIEGLQSLRESVFEIMNLVL